MQTTTPLHIVRNKLKLKHIFTLIMVRWYIWDTQFFLWKNYVERTRYYLMHTTYYLVRMTYYLVRRTYYLVGTTYYIVRAREREREMSSKCNSISCTEGSYYFEYVPLHPIRVLIENCGIFKSILENYLRTF